MVMGYNLIREVFQITVHRQDPPVLTEGLMVSHGAGGTPYNGRCQ